MDKKTATAIANNLDAASEQLETIAGVDTSVDRLLAKHPSAGFFLLENLSHSSDKATRKAVVLNPNTPKETLLRLAPQFPSDFFLNPTFDWLLLEDPNLLFSVGQGVLKNILKHPECPESFMKWAVEHGSEQEKLAVAMNPNAQEGSLQRLVTIGGEVGKAAENHANLKPNSNLENINIDTVFRKEVAEMIADITPEEARNFYEKKLFSSAQWSFLNDASRIDRLPSSPIALVSLAIANADVQKQLMSSLWGRRLLSSCSTASPELYKKLSQDPDSDVLFGLSLNSNAGEARREARIEISNRKNLLERLCDEIRYGEDSLLSTEDIQDVVASNKDIDILAAAAKHQNCPGPERQQLLTMLARNRSAEVRMRVADNPYCSADLLEELSVDKNADVRMYVAANPSSPQIALSRLVEDRSSTMNGMGYSIPETLARNRNCSEDILQKLAGSKLRSIRETVASHANCNQLTFEVLANDAEKSVRQCVAWNPKCSQSSLQLLSNDSEDSVRWRVATNSSTSPKLLEQMALEKSVYLRRRVAENPNCPIQALRQLTNDPAPEVRYAASQHKDCPAEIKQSVLEELALNWIDNSFDRNKILQEASLPSEALRKLSKDKGVDVRCAIASRTDCPEECLRILSKDKSTSVRYKVALNPGCPPALLKELSDDNALLSALISNSGIPEDELALLWARLLRINYEFTINCVEDVTYGDSKNDGERAIPELFLKQVEQECVAVVISPRKSIAWAWLQNQIKDDAEKRACADGDMFYIKDDKADSACNNSSLIVRLLGLSNKKVAPSLLVKRCTSTAWVERMAVARNSNTPPNIIEKLKRDPNRLVARQAEITSGTKTTIAEHQREDISQASSEINLSTLNKELANRISKHSDGIFLALNSYGGKWAYSFEILELLKEVLLCYRPLPLILALRENALFRKALVLKTKLSSKTLSPWETPETSTEELEQIYMDSEPGVTSKIAEMHKRQVRESIARHPATSSALLDKLATDTNMRILVAANPAISHMSIEALSRDGNWKVRSTLAHNKAVESKLSSTILADLDHDSDFKDWISSMSNYSSKLKVYDRIGITMNARYVPATFLTAWANDESFHPIVRFASTCNPNYTEEKRMEYSEKIVNRMEALFDNNPDISEFKFSLNEYEIPFENLKIYPDPPDRKSIEKASKSKDWLKRAAVAICPETQSGILKMLLDDEVEVVQQIAAKRLNEVSKAWSPT